MPKKTLEVVERILNRFGYAPIRDSSQTLPELAENLQWETKPAKTLDYLASYEQAIWTYAAVFRIATTGAKVPFKIYKKRVTKKGKRTEVTDKLVNQVLETPNPYTTRFNLWEATLAFAELTGNSYWELVSEGDQPPEEIYVLRPDHMEIRPSRQKLVDYYLFNINGKDIRLLPEDVLHFKYFSAVSELYGTSANTAAEKSIVLDLYSLDFNARFFKAGARIMGVLETDRHLSDKAMKRLSSKWIGKYGGVQKAFKTPVLEEGLKYHAISSSHTDMEFIEQRKMTREEILAAYGVPPAIVGLFEYANYANSREQKKLFWEDTMLPKLIKMQEYVSVFLLPRYGTRLVGEFDLTTVSALQDSEEVKAKTATTLVDSGIMTADEARDIYYHLDKVPGGAKRTIRGKYVVVEDNPPPGEGGDPADDVTPGEDIDPDSENPDDENPDGENPDGENPDGDENFDFSRAESKEFIHALRKRIMKRLKEFQ